MELIHGVKTLHVPQDVAAAVIDVALQIDADQSAREAELRQVMAKMRAQLAGCHLPTQIFDALAPPYLPDAYTKLCNAIKDMHPPNPQCSLAKHEATREAELAGVTLDDDVDSPMKVVKS